MGCSSRLSFKAAIAAGELIVLRNETAAVSELDRAAALKME
jgi:hypothetical protein